MDRDTCISTAYVWTVIHAYVHMYGPYTYICVDHDRVYMDRDTCICMGCDMCICMDCDTCICAYVWTMVEYCESFSSLVSIGRSMVYADVV